MTLAHVDGEGYVAAAYLVFLAIVLVYVTIMARRLVRVERELDELTGLAAKRAEHDAGRDRDEVPA